MKKLLVVLLALAALSAPGCVIREGYGGGYRHSHWRHGHGAGRDGYDDHRDDEEGGRRWR